MSSLNFSNFNRFNNLKNFNKINSDKFNDKFNTDKFNSDKFNSDKFNSDKFNSDTLFVNIHSTNLKRISTDDLINYIKENINTINNPTLSNNIENNYIVNNIKENDIDNDIDNDIENDIEKDIENGTSLFSLQQGSTGQILNLPINLTNIFNKFMPNMYRLGVMKHNLTKDNHNNISLLSSVLSCLKEEFIQQQNQYQQLYVSQLNNNLITFINSDQYKIYCYKKTDLKQNEIMAQIKAYQNNKIVLKILADYFHVNIFLLHIPRDQLLVTNNFNKFKKNILLLSLTDNSFEPIFYKNMKSLDNNIDIIEHLYDTECYELLFGELEVEDNYDKYLKLPNQKIKYSLKEYRLLQLLNDSRNINKKIDNKINNKSDNKTDNKIDNKSDNKINNKSDNKIDNKSDNKIDNKSDNKIDNKSDNKIDNKSDNKIDNKSDNKIDNKSDNKIDNKSDNKMDKKSDKKSDNKSNNKSNNKIDNKSDNKIDNKSDNKIDNKIDNKTDNKESAIENDVEGINEIMECSETCDREIPDLSESENDLNCIIEELKKKSYDEKKRKLEDLQKDAESLNISLKTTTKNGKKKNKTKKVLIKEIRELIDKN